jgi:hypothetical protein
VRGRQDARLRRSPSQGRTLARGARGCARDAGDGEHGMASVAKDGVAGAPAPAEERKLVLLILRLQLVLAALMTFAIGCFAVPAQLAAQRYDSAPRCAVATRGPDCVAFVPVTVASIGRATNGKETSYWLELTGIGAGQTQFTPATPDAGISGLVGQVAPGQQVTAVLWHGDLVQVQSAAAVAVDSGSPDVGARNWLGGFAIPCSCLLGLLIMYIGRRRSGRRRTVLTMITGVLVILNGPAFLILQYELTAKPSPLLALASFAGVVVVAAGLWKLNAWGERRKN